MPTAIITGSTTGLGFETARELTRKGYATVITYRNQSRGEIAVRRLREEFPNASISAMELTLDKASSVDSFSDRVRSELGTWDLLVNNAGAKVLKDFATTDSGCEYHYGVNAVGHFAITLDLLKIANPKSRVVSVSSIVANFAPKKLGPIGYKESYSPGASYAASKLANLLFAIRLRELGKQSGIESFAAHPGFARAEPYGNRLTRFFESFLAQSAESGAKPIVSAAIENLEAIYLAPAILEIWGKAKPAKIPKAVTNQALLENWEILENLSGRKLSF